MKKIVFVALNSSWSQSNLALYYLRESVCDLDYESTILTFTMKEPLMQILNEVYRHNADIICLSAYIWNRPQLLRIYRELAKLLPEALFVVGGPEASHFQSLPRCEVILGPGERAFRALAEAGFIGSIDSAQEILLKDIPFPYRSSDLEDLQDHLVYYECYRGCPYNCIYCLSACDSRHQPRFDLSQPSEQEKLYNELTTLSRLKPRTLKFIDRSFNVQKDLAHAIWRYILEKLPEHDSHFEIYPDLLDEDDFAILEQIPEGKIRFEIGIQSTNDEVLQRCGRQSSWEKSKAGLISLKERTKVRIHADLIAGLPGEDFDSVTRSLDELCACEPAAVQLGMLKILPDTPMLEIARENSYLWLDDPPYQVLASDALSYTELCELDDYAHLLSLYWNKEEFPQLWHELLQKYRATELLRKLRAIHLRQGLPLHSVSAKRRRENIHNLRDHLC